MKFSSALLLLTSAVLGVRPSSAQGKPLYYEVGTTLTLEPDVSNVPQPITTIRWKYGTALVVDWDPSGHTYYGSFKGRTTFDPETMRLVINLLTLADSGQFSLETNVGIHVTYEVEVIKPKYFEVGTTLTLEPDVSTVEKPIYSIRWKCGTALVVDWDLSGHTYYGSFRGRTTLDPQTLRFDINRLTLADSGQFSLETNLGIVGTYEVKVIKPPPTPSIMTQPLLCEFTCALKCAADTTDLGPVSYEWKKDEGEWNKGDALKNISSSDTPEKFSCRLKTRVRTSEASIPKDNPLYKPPEPKYFEVGTTLTLEPDVSTVEKPIYSIRWKCGTALVVDWDLSGHTYYGSFRGRTTLDPQTLRFDINRLTLADSGQFSLETNLGIVGTYEVKVIKPPPTPSIMTQPLLCEFTCALKCAADTTDLGPVSYEWKKDEGEWNKGDALKNISSSDTPEKFSCRLKTRVRTSEASIPKDNPLYKPPDGLTFGDIFGIRIGILCGVAVIAVITVISLVKCRPGDGELGKKK
ncbi:uncharacterized protein LOC130380389 isoform X3 [Gadus chalcogrammus]|uniref:uncharacterized protein LOC130380389 isoform X3 n=1 Tax=Gadus chalcogrammus TaxID=1042646 RepID=UPI0024C3B823|nr:uncharacterized protein LOC130380389 isoform X3 [Gadus chalcogrammus]